MVLAVLSHKKIRGYLYVGDESLYFSGRSKILFWETKSIMIEWERLRRIQVISPRTESVKNTKKGEQQNHGLRFVENDEKANIFESVDDVRTIWASLLSIHNEKLTKITPNRPRLQYRRMSSDPNLQISRPLLLTDSSSTASASALDTSFQSLITTENGKETGEGDEETEQDWSTVRKVGKYDTLVRENHSLNCSLDDFLPWNSKDLNSSF